MIPRASLDFIDSTHVRANGRALLYFAGSNYLGLSRHPRLIAAMRRALGEGFLQPGASRSTTGEHALYLKAESALAEFFERPAAAMLAAGYLAPIAAFQALRHEATHILLDDAAHPCVTDGAAVSGLPVKRFPHGDVSALRRLLAKLPASAKPVLACDGLPGARGFIPPLREYFKLLPANGWMLVDDAHGAGVMGPGGRGTAASFGLASPRVIQTISLSKAFGLQGGAVIGSARFLSRLKSTAAAYIGNTSPLLPTAAAVVEAVAIPRAEPERLQRLSANIALLASLLPANNDELHHEESSPVLTVLPRNGPRRRGMQHRLLQAGVFPSWIQYVSGPASGFFRFAVTSEHTAADLEAFASALRGVS